MYLIVGLGNPGDKYKNNRHNVGFMFLDYLIKELSIAVYEFSKNANAEYAWAEIKGKKVEFFKPLTFMNNSGRAVKHPFKKHVELKTENMYVVHDDLDIPLGKFKIQLATGPKLHNGIESIENHLKTKDFWRIRIGVDNRAVTGWMDGETYTLQDFRPEEKRLIEEVFPSIWDRLKDLIIRGSENQIAR